MLAECYGRLGDAEQRLGCPPAAAAGGEGSESARIELARALSRSGKLDQALAILLPLAEHRPELRLDIARLAIQKTLRQPRHKRDWREAEQALLQAEKARPQDVEILTSLRLDMLTARNRPDEAAALLASTQAKYPRNLQYRLALAELAQRQGDGPRALQIVDQAEKDLGPSLTIQLARLELWSRQGGDQAQAAVAKLAENRQQLPEADRLAFLDQLAVTEIRLRQPSLARQYWSERADLDPGNIQTLLALFDLATTTGDQAEAEKLVNRIRGIEGERGSSWRFCRALLQISGARRGEDKASSTLKEARTLVDEIVKARPDWWGGAVLTAGLAELDHNPDAAIAAYRRAVVDLGYDQPGVIQRLLGLLDQADRVDEIELVVENLRGQGRAPAELTLATAQNAMRKADFERGIRLARQVLPESSTSAYDHLLLGRFYGTAGRFDEAGKQFARAVELGPGVPDAWLSYVRYLVQMKQVEQAKGAIEAAQGRCPRIGPTWSSRSARCWWATRNGRRPWFRKP